VAVSFDAFERLKDKGIAAYKAAEYSAAGSYLTQAAECIIEIAEGAADGHVRRQHEQLARELIELARDCSRRKSQPGAARARAGVGDEEDTTDARDWIVREKPAIGFDDIAGLEDVKDEIRLKMIYPFTHAELARRYGIGIGGGVLLFGPPGTGKTMMAKAIAHELDATFFVVSPAQILSKWVGQAEQNVRKLFDLAEAEPRSVIFIDEIEALVPRRRISQSTVMSRVVPQILQELEGFDRRGNRPLLFVGATNEPWSLDPAVMRPGRFDAKIYVPLPDAPARHKMLEMYLASKPLADDVDLGVWCDRLAGYSGADIKNIAERAAAIPFVESVRGQEPRPIGAADLQAVIEQTPPSVRNQDLARFEQFAELVA
jgi:transitional endoplasmic reticulum ATPase